MEAEAASVLVAEVQEEGSEVAGNEVERHEDEGGYHPAR